MFDMSATEVPTDPDVKDADTTATAGPSGDDRGGDAPELAPDHADPRKRSAVPEGYKSPRDNSFKHKAALHTARFVKWLLNSLTRLELLSPTWHERRQKGEDIRGIYAGWHAYLWHATIPLVHQGNCAMVSSHRDGEIIAQLLAKQGFELARGSSTRGGARAIMGFVRAAKEHNADMLATIDGPRGPARKTKPGVLYVASLTGLPIIPVGLAISRCWKLNSWDEMMIGKPFSRVVFALGPELRVPRGTPREELADWGRRLAAAMDAAEQRAEAVLAGESDPGPAAEIVLPAET